jgi:transposase
MGKKGIERRTYTKEFKAEAVALGEKREKSISRIAVDLGVNENVLRRWMQQVREGAQGAVCVKPHVIFSKEV